MIRFNEVGFSYDGTVFALDGIDLFIEEGSFVCILGGNGSGKSTLVKHINALLIPDKGVVTVLGADTQDERNLYLIRSNAGMVFQNPDDQLIASLIENDIAFGPENLGVHTEELRNRVKNALAQVGLQGFEKNETTALSGGQKQRVAIAGILAMNPRILILDEATAMLDPRGRSGLLRVCQDLNESGMTIVMITHFMDEATITDRVIVLDEGRVALDGTPQQVLTQTEVLNTLNLKIPFAYELSQELQNQGMPVSACVSERDLEEELCRLLLST